MPCGAIRAMLPAVNRAAIADDVSGQCQTGVRTADVWQIAISVVHSRLVLH